MKKYIIIAAAVIAAMACSKVENIDTPAQKITFQAANYVPQTKATGEEVSVFGDFKSFKSRAFLHAEGVDLLDADHSYAVNGTSYQEFFGATGETISPYDASNAIITNPTKETTTVAYWAPSHEYYWPKSTHSFVNFVGWYGTDGTNAVDPTIAYAYNNDAWTATMTWTWSSTTVGEAGANFLYADMAWRYNNNPAAEYGFNGLSNNYNKGVPMLFHHALAQINVKAYASAATAASGEPANSALTAGTNTVTDGNATWTIILKNVKITPIFAAGTLALTNADPGSNTTQAWSGDWAGTGTAGDFTTTNFTVDQVTKANAEDVFAATCVLPQTLSASVVLSFDLDITTDYGDEENHEIIPISIKLNDMGTNAWVKNTKYTYYLQINPSQKRVRFDPALEADWSTATTTDQTI